MENSERITNLIDRQIEQARVGNKYAQEALKNMGVEWEQKEPGLAELAESLNSPEMQNELASLLSEQTVISEPTTQPESAEIVRSDGGLTMDQQIELSQMRVATGADNQPMYADEIIEGRRQTMVDENRRLAGGAVAGEPVTVEPDVVENEPTITLVESILGVEESEEKEPVWYEELNKDLREASMFVSKFKDKEKTVPRAQVDIDADYQKVTEAKQRLEDHDIDIDIFTQYGGSKSINEARRVLFEGRTVKSGMTEEGARRILDEMNIDTGRVLKERNNVKVPVSEPAPSEVKDDDVKKTERPDRQSRFRVETEADLILVLEKVNELDPETRTRILGSLAGQLFKEGKYDLSKKVSERKNLIEKEAKMANVIGIPKIKETSENRDEVLYAWREWARARIASILDPELRRTGKNPGNIFGAIAETIYGRQNTDGSLYFPAEVSDEMYGTNKPDGRVEKMGEIQVANEIGRIYQKWKDSHKGLSTLERAFDVKSGGEYELPSNAINKFLLNDLKSETGVDGEGSKNIAKALKIYWAMSHSNEPEGKTILLLEGLAGVKSIFNNPLSVEDREKVREKVAEKCGGIFYENIGLMYAGFFGVTAYGSDSAIPGIEYADAMGRLIYTDKMNQYSNKEERMNPGKRATRYLNDLVANNLIVYYQGKPYHPTGKTEVPVQLGVHPGNFQSMQSEKGEKYFYFAEGVNGRVVFKKKLGEGQVDSGEKLEGLIKSGRIHEIDWGQSDDMMAIMKYREGNALKLYKLYSAEDDITKLGVPEIVGKRELFDATLPQYNKETRQNAALLWVYSIFIKYRSGQAFNIEAKRVLKTAVDNGLVTANQSNKIKREFLLF